MISDGYQGYYWNDNSSKDPAISTSDNGEIHVIWSDESNGKWKDNSDDSEIMYVNYTPSTGWSNATVISDGFEGIFWNNDDSRDPDIAVDKLGNIFVVWNDNTDGKWGNDNEVLYVNYTSTLGWSNVTVISDCFQGIS